MGNYLAFWKRGWWAWLLALASNIAIAVLIVPLAFAFHDNQSLYWLAVLVVWLVGGAPIWGWLFEYFAAGSSRLITKDAHREITGERPDGYDGDQHS